MTPPEAASAASATAGCDRRRHRRTWQRLLQANQHAVAHIMARLEGSGVSPQRALAVAAARDVELDRAIDLIVEVPRRLGEWRAGASADARFALVNRLRQMAAAHADQLGTLLPQGVSHRPPQRPGGFDLTNVSLEHLGQANDVLETNNYPVSSPAFERPADPLFATWFKALDLLGTRELTMAEMNGWVFSNVEHEGHAADIRLNGEFRLVFNPQVGLRSVHELHKFLGGFRRLPGERGITPGHGGEGGLFARATDSFIGFPESRWGEEADIGAWWGKLVQFLSRDHELLRDAPVPDPVEQLTTRSRDRMLSSITRYLSIHALDVRNPAHRIDAVEVYRLYRSLLAAGELVTRATVEGWLEAWGVRHVP
jgi:hypothetical protein